jgi:hypothetical protein
MKFDSENDGPFETLFGAFEGYNVKMTWDGEEREVQIQASLGFQVQVQLFVDDEDSPTGEVVTVRYEDVEELVVY